ncbi:MAG: type II toxin-antitoxin system VapC family toxin [Actinomycetota bacterium]|nr:type II toxin-antitoxin system VapC family toxin [Actinomycetota bacterium]
MLLDPGPAAEPIRGRIESPGESVHVPHLLDLEVLNVLRRQTLRGILAKERGVMALQDLENIKMTRYPHTSFLGRIWELRDNLTAYDAAYVALAEALDAPLVTTDARLAQASGNRATVELYG